MKKCGPSGNAPSAAADGPLLKPNLPTPTSAASFALPSGLSLGVRGLAEQAESTETKRFKEPTDPLLSAREVSPQTNLPADEALERRGLRGQKPPAEGLELGGGVPLDEVFAAINHVQIETGIAVLEQGSPFRGRTPVLFAVDEEHRDTHLIEALP